MREDGQARQALEALARGDTAGAERFLDDLSALEWLEFDALYEAWASEGQKVPTVDGWRTWLMMGGRGFGKTRAGSEWVHSLAKGKRCRIALVGATIDDARRVMVEGPSGVIATAMSANRMTLKWEPSQRKLTWPNGSTATIFSGEDGNGLRGPEHDFAWCDEIAKWSDADEAWDNLQFGLRRGDRPRALVTTTPKSIPLLQKLRLDPLTVESGGASDENVSLPQRFIDTMRTTYAGTQAEQRELDGKMLDEAEGSLWPRALIARCRVSVGKLPQMDRVVVGVDPPAGANATSDACGIVVAGRSGANYYVLADASVQGASPERWAAAVRAATATWHADRIVAEANNGGAMVGSVLAAAGIDKSLVKLVHASRGKVARAEPVAVRFEAGGAWFAGTFAALEDELSGLQMGGGYEGPTRSPDRADAMVWAMTELGARGLGGPSVRSL
jgi:phage terminase large subunit-like protein